MNKLTTRRIAGIGMMMASGAIAATVIVAPHAHADTGDTDFLGYLHRQGYTSGHGDVGFLVAGHEVCQELATVRDRSDASLLTASEDIAQVIDGQNPALDLNESEHFTAAAVVFLCPWNGPSSVRSTATA